MLMHVTLLCGQDAPLVLAGKKGQYFFLQVARLTAQMSVRQLSKEAGHIYLMWCDMVTS